MKQFIPELLAPVGTRESLFAAVTAGADAVYLGIDQFNARRGAENFTLDTLQEACDYAHLRNVKVYLTLNTLILPREFVDALEVARQAYRRGIDAVIVQDLGLIAELRRTLPDLEIHASTQINTHTEAGIRTLAELGVKRITLGRELSALEIAHLSHVAHEFGVEIEAFVHGALCVCYSGQCYLSSLIGGRSANRGLCAQACRLPYELRNKALRKALNAPGEHLLSPKDLCLVDYVPELTQAGVTSLKIEGRMKSAEYVSVVTRVYRAVLDRMKAGKTAKATNQEHNELEEAFSRGFTSGYFTGNRDNSIMSYTRPNNRGVALGRVEDVAKSTVTIRAKSAIGEGDVLEFWTGKGNFTHTVTANEASPEGVILLSPQKRPRKGDRVFRVRKGSSNGQSSEMSPKIPLKGAVFLYKGEPLKVTFSCINSEESVMVEGPLVEPARTKELEKVEVEQHINRLGNTPFMLESLDVNLDSGIGISFSVLHKVRSQALEQLTEEMLKNYRSRTLPRVEKKIKKKTSQPQKCLVAVYATNPTCARAARKAGADLIYISALSYKRGEATIAGQLSQTVEQAGYPKKSIIALPEVAHDQIEGVRESYLGFDVGEYVSAGKTIMVENLGQLSQAARQSAIPEAGPHLSLTNAESIQVAADLGATRVWLSPELSLHNIEDLADQSALPLGLTIKGAQKLMTTEHCVLMSQGPCNQECASCPRRRSPHYLKDRKGYEFTVITDLCGRSHIYNAVPLDVSHAVPEIIRAGVSALMVDATLMTSSETTQAIQRVVRAREIALSGDNSVAKAEDVTSGHLFKRLS